MFSFNILVSKKDVGNKVQALSKMLHLPITEASHHSPKKIPNYFSSMHVNISN